MNRLGRAVLDSPARGAALRRYVIPTIARLGGDVTGRDVLDMGCGGGRGTQLILGVLGARAVDAIDIDPAMVALARRRLANGSGGSGRARVRCADMVATGAPAEHYDAVIDLGAIHLEPQWRGALLEVRRVLRPGGLFCFEEIVRPSRQALSALAVGRPIRSDFGRATFVAELAAVGFTVVGMEDVGWPAWTGLIGDVVGVAR